MAVSTRAADHIAVREITGGMGRSYARPRTEPRPRRGYQAWPAPQCGHATEVLTAASKT